MDSSIVNALWMLVCVALVFLMQGGFLCLESGLTRSKDSINVAVKNMTDFSISLLMFWAFGFAVMFGVSYNGLWGTTQFFVSSESNDLLSMTTFLFHAMFCATATTIVSGAVAGRMRFSGYIFATIVVSGFVYPLFGHWAWGGTESGITGCLRALGFVDFAGATVVHSVGGWAALAGVLVLGPRIGIFEIKSSRKSPCSNLPLAMVGAMLLWMGWTGFNGGSAMEMNDSVAGIIANTFLAGASGMLTALIAGWIVLRHANIQMAINGSLAGLVSVTSCCHAVPTTSAVIIGFIGTLVMLCTHWLLRRCKIDDAIGAIPVHLGAGIWGTLAVAFFADPEILGTGLSFSDQLWAQMSGIAASFAVTFGITYVSLSLYNRVYSLRVTPEQETAGLNISEHGAGTELNELLLEMEEQRRSGAFDKPVHVELYSEVGEIAAQYNQVLDVVNSERKQLVDSNEEVQRVNEQLIQAQQAIESQLSDLAEFNDSAVNREIRMIDLKQEINSLCRQVDLPPRYVLDSVELEHSQ